MKPVLDVGLSLPIQDELAARDYVALARLAEEEGFQTVTVGEIAGIEAFAVLSAIASTTTHIRIGSGIIAIYNRSPVLTAMGFASLASLAPGRIFAGLGTGSHRIVEDWNGHTLVDPLQTMRAYVSILRTIAAGERVDRAEGTVVVREFRLQHPAPTGLPVMIGAFHRGMLRLAGAIADGVLLALWPPSELPSRIADIREGACEAGRDPDSIEILASVHSYAGPDIDRALERLRRLVLEYAVRPTHRAAYVGSFPEIDRATELWNAGRRREALVLVPDGAVMHVCAIGSAEAVADRLEETRAAGATLPLLFPHSLEPGNLDIPAATTRAVAEELRRRRERATGDDSLSAGQNARDQPRRKE